MQSELRHNESWTISILPGEDETWPLTRPYVTATRDFLPDKVVIILIRRADGELGQHVGMSGRNLRMDGTPGTRRASYPALGTLPDWLREVVAKARAEHGLDGTS